MRSLASGALARGGISGSHHCRRGATPHPVDHFVSSRVHSTSPAGLRQPSRLSCSTRSVEPSAPTTATESPRDKTDGDTIAAIVTGGQQGAVSILRLSGAAAVSIAQTIFRAADSSTASTSDSGAIALWSPRSHRVYYGRVVDESGAVIDEVLCICMLAPRSYTTEDVIELHTHGGGVSATRVLHRCLSAGARLASPGEFTLRAFLNGRLDLSQAESVLQLIEARTPAAADSALAGLGGGIGAEVGALRQAALQVLAELEARLDFDEDMPAIETQALKDRIASLQGRVEAALRTCRHGRLLRQGLQVALVGRPNVGKSSLLNAWTGTERAIVTDIAGTTRDVVDAGVVLSGVPVTLLDTAGIRDAEDEVERQGVERSERAACAADVVLLMVDCEVGWTDEDDAIFARLWGGSPAARRLSAPCVLVANKIDRVEGWSHSKLPVTVSSLFGANVATVSATERRGLGALEDIILRLAGASPEGGRGWAVNDRQAEALVRAHEAFMKVADSIEGDLPIDFWTIDLRDAFVALGEVTGDDITEDILDTVFSSFCIGK